MESVFVQRKNMRLFIVSSLKLRHFGKSRAMYLTADASI